MLGKESKVSTERSSQRRWEQVFWPLRNWVVMINRNTCTSVLCISSYHDADLQIETMYSLKRDFSHTFKEGMQTHLVASAIAGFCCSAASNPVDVIKVSRSACYLCLERTWYEMWTTRRFELCLTRLANTRTHSNVPLSSSKTKVSSPSWILASDPKLTWSALFQVLEHSTKVSQCVSSAYGRIV